MIFNLNFLFLIFINQYYSAIGFDCECSFPAKFKTTIDFSIDESNFKVLEGMSGNEESSRRTLNERITLHVDMDNQVVIEERPGFYVIRTKSYVIQKSKSSNSKVCLRQSWKSTTWQGCGFPNPITLQKDLRSNKFCYRYFSEDVLANTTGYPSWYGTGHEVNDVLYEYRGSCQALEECMTRNSQYRVVRGKSLDVYSYRKRYWFKTGTIDAATLSNSFVQELKNLCP